MLSYDAERKMLRKLGQVLNNRIVVTRLLFEISNCILPILVLVEMFNTPEDYVAVLKNYPFLKYEKSKWGRVRYINVCSDDESIIDRMLNDKKKTSELE